MAVVVEVGARLAREVKEAVEKLRAQEKPDESMMLVDDGGVVVVVARGEMGDGLLDFVSEAAARRRVPK